MPPEEELIIRGKKKVNGEWVDVDATPADELQKDKSAPLATDPPKVTKEGVTNAVKVQRAIRDFKTNAYFPPLALIDSIRDMATGKVGDVTAGIPVGTGETRNILTNTGGRLGLGLGALLGLPSGPGAIATSVAGYGAGSAIGSGIGQELEAAAPDLFQSGYGSIDGPERTVPSLSNAVKDTAVNTAMDVGLGVAGKVAPFVTPQRVGKYFTNSPTGKAAWDDLVERAMTSKYNPAGKNPIATPLTAEEVDALNATPNVSTTTGQVLDENSWFNKMQQFLRGEETSAQMKRQEGELGNELIDYRRLTGVPDAQPGVSPAQIIGQRGIEAANARKATMSAAESRLYNEIPRFGSTMKVTTGTPPDPNSAINKFRAQHGQPPIGGSSTSKDVVGPIKLTRSQTVAATEGKKLDEMIAAIPDPALAAELKIIRARMAVGEGERILPWDVVREMETQMGRLSSNPNLPPALKQELNGIRATLVADIEKNLSGGIKETAPYWKPGALNKYHDAKAATVAKHDLFPEEIQATMEKAGGDIVTRPGERGGIAPDYFADILKSPQQAKRLAETGGNSNARAAFVQQFLEKYQNPETKQLFGNKALADWESGTTKAIAEQLFTKAERQKLRYLMLRSKEINPNISKLGQLAVEQQQGSWALNLPSDAANALFGGKPGGLFKTGGKLVSVMLGAGKFTDTYLLNDQFARRIANAMGKPANRPGMGKEIAEIIKNVQGAKLLIRADKEEYLYDTDTKKLEPVPK